MFLCLYVSLSLCFCVLSSARYPQPLSFHTFFNRPRSPLNDLSKRHEHAICGCCKCDQVLLLLLLMSFSLIQMKALERPTTTSHLPIIQANQQPTTANRTKADRPSLPSKNPQPSIFTQFPLLNVRHWLYFLDILNHPLPPSNPLLNHLKGIGIPFPHLSLTAIPLALTFLLYVFSLSFYLCVFFWG